MIHCLAFESIETADLAPHPLFLSALVKGLTRNATLTFVVLISVMSNQSETKYVRLRIKLTGDHLHTYNIFV